MPLRSGGARRGQGCKSLSESRTRTGVGLGISPRDGVVTPLSAKLIVLQQISRQQPFDTRTRYAHTVFCWRESADRRDNAGMSDEEVVRLRAIGTSFRQIARELGVSLAGVQRALKRAAS
jgi:hypothetical protein